jgi:hypothetical protein
VARGWVSSSSIIDDVANLRHLPEVLALAGEGESPLERLRRIACGLGDARRRRAVRRGVDEDARRPAAGWLKRRCP